MGLFKRGLSTAFVERLNEEYKPGSWWQRIADDPQLFIAIRDEYLNVYWKGNSLLRLRMEEGALIGEAHYKYLLRPDCANPYIPIAGGRPTMGNHADFFFNDISEVTALKRAADVYAGEEKTGVHKIVMSNPNIIDVEIAFSTTNEKSGARVAQRIDFAALKRDGSAWELVLYEAKAFSNPELRASGEGVPVLNQIEGYRQFLRTAKAEITDSYRTVCGNLLALDGVNNRFGSLQNGLKEIAEGRCKFSVSDDVRLVVFGYDGDQSCGSVWTAHRQKLFDALGDKLLLKGDAKGMVRGISSNA